MTVKDLVQGVAEHWGIDNQELSSDDTELYVQLPPAPGCRTPQIVRVRDIQFTYLSDSRNRVATEQEYDDGDTRPAFLLEV